MYCVKNGILGAELAPISLLELRQRSANNLDTSSGESDSKDEKIVVSDNPKASHNDVYMVTQKIVTQSTETTDVCNTMEHL